MKCPTEPKNINYLKWKEEADRLLNQYDAAFGRVGVIQEYKPSTIVTNKKPKQ